jgi:hypothetical protein
LFFSVISSIEEDFFKMANNTDNDQATGVYVVCDKGDVHDDTKVAVPPSVNWWDANSNAQKVTTEDQDAAAAAKANGS